jgi:hypothetical protein
MTHLHFDHCGGSVQWNAEKRDMSLLSKTLNSGVMKAIGNGQQTRTLGKHLPFENIPMQESGQLNFIKRPTGIS